MAIKIQTEGFFWGQVDFNALSGDMLWNRYKKRGKILYEMVVRSGTILKVDLLKQLGFGFCRCKKDGIEILYLF